MFAKQDVERFWSKVDRRQPDECWLWIGKTIARGGYGQIWFNCKRSIASRVAMSIALGREPNRNIYVCHRCDNPPCCNPSHLFLGTCSENGLDSVSKGRSGGENSGVAKIDSETAHEIRQALLLGASQRAIARLYAIKQPAVSLIARGETWVSHV